MLLNLEFQEPVRPERSTVEPSINPWLLLFLAVDATSTLSVPLEIVVVVDVALPPVCWM